MSESRGATMREVEGLERRGEQIRARLALNASRPDRYRMADELDELLADVAELRQRIA